MKAMILAAGLGTRLRPLTDHRPKALVKIAGRTLLEVTLFRLRNFGIQEVIINVHHFADMVVNYLEANHSFGMTIDISREEILLDTGGGLKKAAGFFLQDSTPASEPFILHNVDVISTIDLGRMVQFHEESHALVTLAVKDRNTERYLLFDNQLELCGRQAGRNREPEYVRPTRAARALAFSGIHVISPRLLTMLTEEGAFPIMTAYLRLAARQQKILGFRVDEYYWRDLGTLEHVRQAEQDVAQKSFLP